MDKMRMEMILPVKANLNKMYARKKKVPEGFLLDTLHISPLTSDFDVKPTFQIPPLNLDRKMEGKKKPIAPTNSKTYVTSHHEHAQRLNRESKIQKNQEWTELLKKASWEKIHTPPQPVVEERSSLLKHIKNVNQQIDEDSTQLQKIQMMLSMQEKSRLKPELKPKTKNIRSDINLNKSNSHVTHTCTKGIYTEKLNEYNSMLNYIDQHLEGVQPKKQIKQKKITKPPSRTDKNHRDNFRENLRKDRLNNTLHSINSQLDVLKEKYSKTSINEKYSFTDKYKLPKPLPKKSKFRSLKELVKLDQTEFSTMESSKMLQAVIDNDTEDMTESMRVHQSLRGKEPPVQMNVLYENYDFTENKHFHDDSGAENGRNTNRTQKSTQRTQISSARSYKKTAKDFANEDITPRRVKLEKPEKEFKESKSIALGTETEPSNEWTQSIMKSDYLRKEFNVQPHMFVFPDLQGGNKMPSGDVTNAIPGKINKQPMLDKFSRDLDFFMS